MQLKTLVLLASSALAGIAIAKPIPDADPIAVANAGPVADSTADAISTFDMDSFLVERAVRVIQHKNHGTPC